MNFPIHIIPSHKTTNDLWFFEKSNKLNSPKFLRDFYKLFFDQLRLFRQVTKLLFIYLLTRHITSTMLILFRLLYVTDNNQADFFIHFNQVMQNPSFLLFFFCLKPDTNRHYFYVKQLENIFMRKNEIGCTIFRYFTIIYAVYYI